MAEESSESKKLTLSSPHFHIQNLPTPSATLSAVVALMANTEFRILKKTALVHHASE